MVIRSPLRPTRIVPPRLPVGALWPDGAAAGVAAAAGALVAAAAGAGFPLCDGAAVAAAAGLVGSAGLAAAGALVGAGVAGAAPPQAARSAVVATRPALSISRRDSRRRSSMVDPPLPAADYSHSGVAPAGSSRPRGERRPCNPTIRTNVPTGDRTARFGERGNRASEVRVLRFTGTCSVVSRRSMLRGAGVGALAIGLGQLLAACASSAPPTQAPAPTSAPAAAKPAAPEPTRPA